MAQKLVVLCDGTWCGRSTGTVTNISLIAAAIGIPESLQATDETPRVLSDPSRKLKACYFPGAGLGGTFLEYLFNGGTASDIGKDCMEVYQYIVDNFNEDTEIWMFGLSRGCYTVRCVAGMLNNCGIIKRRATSEQTTSLVHEVYDMYRSPFAEDKPSSKNAEEFRKRASWDVKSPIKVMALIDTVGSLGIPKLDAGVGFDWPEFYDQDVSSEVQKVYHACSIHDRLWMFQPCRATRSKAFLTKYKQDPKFEIVEKWFPGCHYDLGRQQFKFLRDGVNIIEKIFFALPNCLTKPVVPNAVCADLLLRWFYQMIQLNDPRDQLLHRGAGPELTRLELRMQGYEEPGSGDVYSNMEEYTPAGIFGSAIWHITATATSIANKLTPTTQIGSAIQSFLGIKSLLNILLATRDRRIQNINAKVVDLDEQLAVLGAQSPYVKGHLERYKSLTLEKLVLRREILRPRRA